MIKLSTKSRYAARFLLELALNDNKKPVLLKDIAGRQGISAGYLEQIAPALKNANLIAASRGAKGGYSLARKASGITLKEIIEAVEGPVMLTECGSFTNSCSRSGRCAAEELWFEISNDINEALGKRTLAHLAEKQRKIERANVFNYSI
jgi:Rrf2 family protein